MHVTFSLVLPFKGILPVVRTQTTSLALGAKSGSLPIFFVNKILL